jgi:hypothetical protein
VTVTTRVWPLPASGGPTGALAAWRYMLQRRQGPSCPPRSCAELRTTDCGAAPAPYINKPHRPPTRPTTCSVPAVSAPLDLHRSQSPVASRLSITVEHVRLVHPHHLNPTIHRHASQEVRRRCCPQGQVWLCPRQLPGSLRRRPHAGISVVILPLSACVRLMRGLQDMITDAIANVRWRQPSD